MAEPAKKIPLTQLASKSSKTFSQKTDSRRSQELVIGVCGPIGSGVKDVVEELRFALEEHGYEVVHIRLSKLMVDFIKSTPSLSELEKEIPSDTNNCKYKRYRCLQNLGGTLRDLFEFDIAASLATQEINIARARGNGSTPQKTATTKKRAYILDQLKHFAEVSTLKKTYGSLFYLFGTLCSESVRLKNLKSEKISQEHANELIEIDRDENLDEGQKLEKTLLRSDFFIENNSRLRTKIKSAITRYLNLIHGVPGITPTTDEYGMYSAYSVGLQSACLSRQVGAAIVDESGNVVSTGKNDVPKKGGGLYLPSDNDHRCVNLGYCSNDKYKSLLLDDLEAEIKAFISDKDEASKLLHKIKENKRIRSLIEYSRSIHAEMDAIISLARRGEEVPENATLYTTTFPCHNCARHIIAAGIARIVYVEPYEKSLAIELHQDALTTEGDSNKVSLEPFEGVSPSKYQLLFRSNSPRKDNAGKVIREPTRTLIQVDEEHVDSYIDKEDKCIEHIKALLSDSSTSTNQMQPSNDPG